jgi:hypothetical protein
MRKRRNDRPWRDTAESWMSEIKTLRALKEWIGLLEYHGVSLDVEILVNGPAKALVNPTLSLYGEDDAEPEDTHIMIEYRDWDTPICFEDFRGGKRSTKTEAA